MDSRIMKEAWVALLAVVAVAAIVVESASVRKPGDGVSDSDYTKVSEWFQKTTADSMLNTTAARKSTPEPSSDDGKSGGLPIFNKRAIYITVAIAVGVFSLVVVGVYVWHVKSSCNGCLDSFNYTVLPAKPY